MNECDRLDRACQLNDQAGIALMHGEYDRAVSLLVQAAAISSSARQALLDRAFEAAVMGVSVEAMAAKIRWARSA